MISTRPVEVRVSKKQVTEGRHYRPSGSVKRLEKSIGKLHGGIGMVGGRKGWRGAGNAEGRGPYQPRRERVGIRKEDVALAIDVLYAEARIEQRLVRVGRRARSDYRT